MSLAKQLLIVIVLAALGAGGYFGYQTWGPQGAAKPTGPRGGAMTVETALAETRTLSTRVEAVGSTIARQSISIVPLADGRIVELNIRPGARVQAGDLLVALDDDLQRADLAEAEATLLKARLEMARGDTLKRSNVASAAQMEDLTANLSIAEAAVARARRKLADRSIRAPFAGTVGLSRLDVGAFVTTATVITSLDDLTSVEIAFAAPEQLFGTAAIGQSVEATGAAYPGRVFQGRVIEIDSRVDPVSRSFALRAELPNSDGALPAGMFMTLAMTLATSEALVVPEQSVVVEGGVASVFVVAGDKVRRTTITIGRREFGIAEVLSGLAPGDEVVTSGVGKLRDGSAIRVIAPAAKTAAAKATGGVQ